MTDIVLSSAKKLKVIVEMKRPQYESLRATCDAVAKLLADAVDRPSPWTWNYIHVVMNSKLNPGKPLITAIEKLFLRL